MYTNEEVKKFIYDSSVSFEERAKYLVSQLDYEEKLSCMTTGCPGIERFGIKSFYIGGEGAHGVQARNDQSFDKGKKPENTTIFQNPIGMSATWDCELIYKAGSVVGDEARALYNKNGDGGICLWAPTVDMERDPRWGRNEEGYGEDPYLTSEMASGYIKGMKGENPKYIKCAATLKHFYANNVEENRTNTSSYVNERCKWEYYLEPYRRIIKNAQPEGVMAAYNSLDGIPAMINPEIREILKNKWGLHHVITDGGAVRQVVDEHHYFKGHDETVTAGLKAGVDMFTDDSKIVIDALEKAVSKGRITLNDIDEALYNHFMTMFRLGIFDGKDNEYASYGKEKINSEYNNEIAEKMAEEGIVMLKNSDKLLPFNANEKTVVIGPMADLIYNDWYGGLPAHIVTPYAGIKKNYQGAKCFDGLPVVNIKTKDNGYLGIKKAGSSSDGSEYRIIKTTKDKAATFKAMLWDNKRITLQCMDNERYLSVKQESDSKTLDLSSDEESCFISAISKDIFGWFVQEVFYMYSLNDENIITFDETNAGRFWMDNRSQTVVTWEGMYPCFDEDGHLIYTDKSESAIELNFETVREPLEEFKNDVSENIFDDKTQILAIMGTHPMVNCKEEYDRESIAFPPYEHALVNELNEMQKRLALVIISNYPFSINDENEKTSAILWSATGNQELGNALANVVFGKVSPAGRLNMTWYKSDSQLPDKNDYDIISNPRTYMYFKEKVLYPFGYGLSYSEFDYLSIDCKEDEDKIYVDLEVKNTGNCIADEVIQIYICKNEKNGNMLPIKQLKAFERSKDINPDEIRHVSMIIKKEEIAYYDEKSKAMCTMPGKYTVMAGASSEDIRLKAEIDLKG